MSVPVTLYNELKEWTNQEIRDAVSSYTPLADNFRTIGIIDSIGGDCLGASGDRVKLSMIDTVTEEKVTAWGWELGASFGVDVRPVSHPQLG